MDANRARHLRQPGDGLFHVGLVKHHQVSQFVNNDHDGRQRTVLILIFALKQVESAVFVKKFVVLLNVADAFFRQDLEAALHLAHRIAQGIRCQAGLGDDRHVQMWNAFIDA